MTWSAQFTVLRALLVKITIRLRRTGTRHDHSATPPAITGTTSA
jgi:hypothetical protein